MERTRTRSREDIPIDLNSVLSVPREERMQAHCYNVCTAMLYKFPEQLMGIYFRCTDQRHVAAHRFVFGIQASYFRPLLYKRGLEDIESSSYLGKAYPFPGSSLCLKYLRQFLYTGCIQELEEASRLEPMMVHIDELLSLALQPRKDHLGGVDAYLVQKLCQKEPGDMQTALARVVIAVNHNIQVLADTMKTVAAKLPFKKDCLLVKDMDPRVLEMILRDFPLQATELEVCEAVHEWAINFYGDTIDSDVDSCPDPDTDLLIPSEEDSRRILQHIDLSFVNPADIKEKVVKLRLFSEYDISRAHRMHSIHQTGRLPTRQNSNRGSSSTAAGQLSELAL